MLLRRHRIFFLDLVTFAASIWMSYAIRFTGDLPAGLPLFQIWLVTAISLATKIPLMTLMGMYRIYWGHMHRDEVGKLMVSGLASWIAFFLVLAALGLNGVFAPLRHFPRSILLLDLLLPLVLLPLGRKVTYLRSL